MYVVQEDHEAVCKVAVARGKGVHGKIGLRDFRGLRALEATPNRAPHLSKTLIAGLCKQPLDVVSSYPKI